MSDMHVVLPSFILNKRKITYVCEVVQILHVLGDEPDIKHGPLDIWGALDAVQGPVDVRLKPHVKFVHGVRSETATLVVDDRGFFSEIDQLRVMVMIVVVGRVRFRVRIAVGIVVRSLHAQKARKDIDEDALYPRRHLVRGRRSKIIKTLQ
ncbi:hypothetical protein TNCV_1242421 [Trichonephila clavipes]|nr:hypothetical protein TNCV_1242421 [Trichonephila clavipes]